MPTPPNPKKTSRPRSRAKTTQSKGESPLKEAFFVGVGILDWAAEQLKDLEQDLKSRGEKRNREVGESVAKLRQEFVRRASEVEETARKSADDVLKAMEEGLGRLRKASTKKTN